MDENKRCIKLAGNLYDARIAIGVLFESAGYEVIWPEEDDGTPYDYGSPDDFDLPDTNLENE